MAAYAALVSLFNTLDQIQNHPRFSASLDIYQIEFLSAHIDFLLDFVENYNTDGGVSEGGAEELKRQIVRAAHEAEDIIESHIANLILPQSALASDVRLHHRCLFGLQKVIRDMDSIKEKVLKFKKEKPPNSTPATSSTPLSAEQSRMVGFEDELKQLMDLVIAQQSSRGIVSLVGMGGTGKTTLAKHVYEDSLTMHHFDFRAWATISQDYDVRDILLHLLSEAEGTIDELGEKLHKKLFGVRYLIVLDDMWSTEVWDRIKFFFPDNGDGSRIVLTTRLLVLATQLCSICIRINFLDEDKSWNLFCQNIFGHKYCPVELEGIGKEIVGQCKGLPLSIVVIGGILRKSPWTKEYWQNVAQNMNAIFNSTENGQCLDVLYLSYSHLPAHLKPCFLYLGTFREDYEICVSEIIRLWVVEGFLKPNGVQILEEMAEGYLNDLIDRNLILVSARRSNRKIRSFHIHDLLRELCVKVANKEDFFCVVRASSNPRGIDWERGLIIQHQVSSYPKIEAFKEPPAKCKLLRVLRGAFYWPVEAKFQNVNLRYVACNVSMLPSSISMMWNLQTLVIAVAGHQIAPLEIWTMTQLRHIKVNQMSLPDPPPSDDKDDSVVLKNLHTLAAVMVLSEEACKRIQNIRKLCMPSVDMTKVGCLQRLESINLKCYSEILFCRTNNFPGSLKMLSLRVGNVYLEDLSMIIGSLPQLEVLKVMSTLGRLQKWSCVEGRFPRLKFLSIEGCALESWTLDSVSCFPVLEKLVLIRLDELNEIPSDIGEIPTLQLIHMKDCCESLVISAMKIKEEQVSFGNDGLQIQVKMDIFMREEFMERVKAEGLSIKNIHFEFVT